MTSQPSLSGAAVLQSPFGAMAPFTLGGLPYDLPTGSGTFDPDDPNEYRKPDPGQAGVTPAGALAPSAGGIGPLIAPASSAQVRHGRYILNSLSLDTLHQISRDFVVVTADGPLVAVHIASGDRMRHDNFVLYCSKHYGKISVTDTVSNQMESKESGAIWWHWDDASKRVVRRVVMEPTNEPEDPFGDVFNCWHVLKKEMVTPAVEASDADIQPLYDHLLYISDGDKVAAAYYLHWLAELWRNPDVKIPWAIVNYSRFQGTGKTFLIQLEAKLFGASMVKNCDGGVLHKGFMDAMRNKRIMGCNELARADRRDSHERLKSLISEETMEFEGKGVASREIRNIVHFHITTNNPDAVPVEDDERRFLVMCCEQPRKEPEYYDRLYAWLNGDGPAKLAKLFEQWQFPADWNPKAPPPLTKAARAMGIASRGELYEHLVQLKADRHPPFDRDLFGLDAATKQYNTHYGDMARNGRVTRGQMSKALKSLFGNPVQLRMLHGTKEEKPRVYTAFNKAQWIAASPQERWAYMDGHGGRPFDATTDEVADHE